MRRKHVDAIIGGMSDRPGAGINMLKRIRTLCRYAVEIEWIDRDPTQGATSYKSKEWHTWTDAEIEQYKRRWPVGTKQRLAFAALYYTAQRGSDVVGMKRPRHGGTIPVKQVKTDEVLDLEIHPELLGSD